MQWFLLVHFVLLTSFVNSAAGPLPKHWHETKSFGTNIKGGIDGEVYKVTNLSSSGPGSLSDAVSKGNRLVVFEVGGVIEGGLKVGSNITVAGQTAPFPGISLIKGNLTVSGSNIVVSHITTMLGDHVKKNADAANVGGGDIVLDHVAVYWSKDENLSMGGPNNVTAYKCIIAEGLQYAGHPDGEHSKGSLITSPKNLALVGCLYAHCAMRNPRVGGGQILIANQVVYNWTTGWDHRPVWFNFVVSVSGTDVTFVGNVGLQGPESKGEFFLDGHINRTAEAYMKDNIIIDTVGKDLHVYDPENITPLDTPPLWAEGLEPLPAEEALYEVLRTVGPRPGDRDRHNARVVKTVADGNGEVIDSQDEVGGYPDYAETKRSLTVPDGAEARQAWLDSLEDEIAVDKKLDLSRLYPMVGSRASDKLSPETSVNRKINLQANGFGIKIIQRNFIRKELHASFHLPTAAFVSLEIIDLAGNIAARRTDRLYKAGYNKMTVNVDHLSAGLYICRFQIGNALVSHPYNFF